MLPLLLPSLLALGSPAQAAEPLWFHPDETDAVEVVAPDGTLYGLPFEATGEVVLETRAPWLLGESPLVVQASRTRLPGVFRVQLPEGAEPFAASRELRAHVGVTWAHPDLLLPMQPRSLTNDPYVGDQWHLENTGQWDGMVDADIDVAAAWERATGEGGMVAVIDSGVDPLHPDLDVIPGRDYVDDDDDSSPEEGDGSGPHGTAAAGLAAALGDNELGVSGVARGSSVYGIRLLTSLEGKGSTTSEVGEAFVEAAEAGAWVINNSWGYADCAGGVLPAVIKTGLKTAEQEGRGGLGSVMVFSAGNDGCDNSDELILSYPTVIGVGATDDHDRHISYSSYGTGTDIAAPSGAVLTTDISGDSGYGSWDGDVDYTGGFSGTSAAAPIVSGVVLLMLEANPRLTAEQVREQLCATADRVDMVGGEWDAEGRSRWFGCGRVNAHAAVAAVANAAPAAPVPTNDGAEATLDAAFLAWSAPEDPDGDRLLYEVEWTLDGTFEAQVLDTAAPDTAVPWEPVVHTVQTDGTRLDFAGELEGDGVVTWRVRALDDWGPSPDSAEATLRVVSDRSTPSLAQWGGGGGGGGCAAVARPAGGFSVLLGLLGLLGLVRRRRG